MPTVPVGRIQKPSHVSIVCFKEHQVYHTCKGVQLFRRTESPVKCFKTTVCMYINKQTHNIYIYIYIRIHTHIQLHVYIYISIDL